MDKETSHEILMAEFKNSLHVFFEDIHKGETTEKSSFKILANQKEAYCDQEKIAQGGAKVIFKIFDTRARRYLAMAKPLITDDTHYLDAFIREAWITSQLDHPNIIKTHQVGIDQNNCPFFTMDLKNGSNLAQIIKSISHKNSSHELNLSELLDIFIKICDAIAHAHSINILHLDLKPANIQIGEYGEVIVCDWGLAKIIGGEKSINLHREILDLDLIDTPAPDIKGTPAYMSPEQVRGEGTSQLSDIYSLAAILYELITLSPTINASDPHLAMEQTTKGIIRPPSELVKIPDGLEAIVMKGLSLNPHERYQSVIELKNDLNKYLSGYTTHAEHSNTFKELLFFYRRNKSLCIQAVIFLTLTLCGSLIFISNLQKSKARVQVARLEAEQNALKHKEALDLYIKEKNDSNHVKREFSKTLTHYSQIYNSYEYINDPETMLLNSLKGFSYKLAQNPKDHNANIMMGLILFILQRYDEVDTYMHYPELNHIKYAVKAAQKHQYKKQGKVVPVEVLISVVKGLKEYGVQSQATTFRAIVYDMELRQDFNKYDQVVKVLFELWNPRWDGSSYHYDPVKQSISCSGNYCNDLRMFDQFGFKTLLMTPIVKHLDVSHSTVHKLVQFENTNLESLNISNSRVKDLSPLNKIETLRQVTISPNRFPQEMIEGLNPRIKVIIQEDLQP
jgi:serine/threonine protein kinase